VESVLVMLVNYCCSAKYSFQESQIFGWESLLFQRVLLLA
jgi:hypothetical protein